MEEERTTLRCNATRKSDGETAGIKGRRLDAVSTAGQLQAGTIQGGDSSLFTLVNDLQDEPEGLDVSVCPRGSVSGLPLAPHPYG